MRGRVGAWLGLLIVGLAGIVVPIAVDAAEPKDYAYVFLQGRLNDARRPRPVAGATVRLVSDSGSRHEVRTDTRGVFVFEKVPLGSYEVQVVAADGTPLEGFLDPAAGEGDRIRVRLEPQGRRSEPMRVEAGKDGVTFDVPPRRTNWRKLWAEIGAFAGLAGLLAL